MPAALYKTTGGITVITAPNACNSSNVQVDWYKVGSNTLIGIN